MFKKILIALLISPTLLDTVALNAQAYKPAPVVSEESPKTKGPKPIKLKLSANAEGFTDTFKPEPNKPPRTTVPSGTR
jgi:hypothetical protein